MALQLGLVERSGEQSFHRVAGSARHVSWDLVGHQAPCCKFLGSIIVEGCAGPWTCLVHVWKRCRGCGSCGSCIFCFEVIMLSWSQAKGAGEATAPLRSSTTFPKLANLAGAARDVGRDWIIGVG